MQVSGAAGDAGNKADNLAGDAKGAAKDVVRYLTCFVDRMSNHIG